MKSIGFVKEVEVLASKDFPVEYTCQEGTVNNAQIINFTFHWQEESRKNAKSPLLEFRWSIPLVELHFVWHPAAGLSRKMKVDWMRDIATMTAVSAPMMSFYNEAGQNACTIVLSETQKQVLWNIGVHEEDGTLLCRVKIPLETFVNRETYQVSLYRDITPVRYETAIRDVGQWWEKDCGITPLAVPEIGRMPMYSTWYSRHQKITDKEIEADCALAVQMGMKSVLVDDGWQTDDNNRGYAFCGDWQAAKSKLPDMAAHVERVHQMGMKYLIWFSVPFVGTKSPVWSRFSEKLLSFDEGRSTGVLDPRYPEVRQYLKDTYISRVKEWNIDGLKLDFIDDFHVRPESVDPKDGMDFQCVQEAVDRMMTEIISALKEIKPDFLIEFRQKYIGPNMRKYGNLFRVSDCPNDLISNRVGMVDLRLLCGDTAVHSDMLMWNPEESCENAAIQIENVLFSTLQFSVLPSRLTSDQKKMVRFWLGFMKEHLDLLQKAPIYAKYPQMLYPLVWTERDRQAIYALYAENMAVELNTDSLSKAVIVNANHGRIILLRLNKPGEFYVTVQDCMGQVVSQGKRNLESLCAIEVPVGGIITLKH